MCFLPQTFYLLSGWEMEELWGERHILSFFFFLYYFSTYFFWFSQILACQYKARQHAGAALGSRFEPGFRVLPFDLHVLWCSSTSHEHISKSIGHADLPLGGSECAMVWCFIQRVFLTCTLWLQIYCYPDQDKVTMNEDEWRKKIKTKHTLRNCGQFFKGSTPDTRRLWVWIP